MFLKSSRRGLSKYTRSLEKFVMVAENETKRWKKVGSSARSSHIYIYIYNIYIIYIYIYIYIHGGSPRAYARGLRYEGNVGAQYRRNALRDPKTALPGPRRVFFSPRKTFWSSGKALWSPQEEALGSLRERGGVPKIQARKTDPWQPPGVPDISDQAGGTHT